ncbi:MAG TPA: 50S ribosomal protein L24 [Chloroflexota bacterium]|nr:50S ribosomal protein L24 [Chloroflexota bacterium]
MFKIKRDDLVEVLKGRERGKRGKIRKLLPKESRAVIADVNIMKKHVKPGSQARQAGIIDIEAPIQLANLALVCSKCGKRTRVSIRVLDDGSKARVCKLCGELT